MPGLRNTITVNVPPAKAWAVVGDLASVSRWVPGITSARVEGWRRICATSDGGEIHEEIHDYSDERRSYGYRHTRVPLPVKDSRGTFSVEPDGSGSRIVWEAEIETLDVERETEIVRMIDANYKATLESLRRQIEPAQMASNELFETFAESLLGDPRLGEGRMMGARVLKVGGKVFAMLVRDKLVVKLPRERVEDLIHSGRGEPFDPGHGRVVKEWVTSAPGREDEWLRLAEEARDFVASIQS